MTTITKTQLNTTLNALIAQRELWQNGTYAKANAELCAILEQCGEIYAALKADKKNARAFNAIADELGVAFNKGTSLALKIVRVVFGAQTNREFAYARVIKVWFDERADEQTLTNFVIERGGIENVRRNSKAENSNKLSAEDYKDIAENVLADANALATLAIEDYMLSDEENITDYVVALVHCDGAGSGKIVYGSNKRGLVSAALTVIGKELDDLQKQASRKAILNEVKQQKAADIKKFIAQVRTTTRATTIN